MKQYSEIELRQSLSDIAIPQILVVGDLMLDRYSWGIVQRISPEAPIPVLQVARDDQRLGGAGNVMMNLSALGAEVLACGVTGEDEAGDTGGGRGEGTGSAQAQARDTPQAAAAQV